MASRTSSPLAHPNVADLNLFEIMSALSEPTRLGIVLALASSPGLACNAIACDVAPSTLTRHFRVLREVGLIRQEDVGNRRVNLLRKEDLNQRFPGLIDMVLAEGAGKAAALPHMERLSDQSDN